VTEVFRLATSNSSLLISGAISCLKPTPTSGFAGMKMPGFAPFTPACQEPSVLVCSRLRFSSSVASPKYQTFPAMSCAYQSVMFSWSLPPMKPWSWTTVVMTPRIVAFSLVTVNVSLEALPSLRPL
jgi:hypothetical protein